MLRLKNISKSFDKLKVLDDINLYIKKGEIISLLGGSGSGKSTVLNIIAGFEEVDNGSCMYKKEILFDDTNFKQAQNRDIGFVFQDYALFPHLSVSKNISFGISKKSVSFQQQTVKKLLALTNMQGYEDKYPHMLSGGEQQRLAISRVLARNSELILFDEPFSSIDTTLKSKLISEIKEIIKSQNKTAIFVTHCPKEAILLSDKIGYIENGKVIQFDTPKNLYTKPVSQSVKNIFDDNSFLFKSINELLEY